MYDQPAMKSHHRTCLVLALLCIVATVAASAEEWYRVESADARASVLFPNPADELTELVDKTPAGAVVTRVAKHQGDGILMSISGSTLPKLAVRFAGPNIIFSNAKGGVLKEAFGKEVSSRRIEVENADAALELRYEAVDFEDEAHPGYTGLAVFVMDGTHLYVVNSMLSKNTPDNQAMQAKLLGSIRIEP